jgi:hypothetical protein
MSSASRCSSLLWSMSSTIRTTSAAADIGSGSFGSILRDQTPHDFGSFPAADRVAALRRSLA